MGIDSEKVREWREMWPLPLICALGVTGSGVFTYASGVFMNAMIKEFGWSRTDYTSAMLATVVVVLAIVPFVGRAVDRFGPRKVALWAIIPAALGPSALGFANGNVYQWWLMAILQAIPVVFMVPTLWLTAVVGRFHASRGLALAVVLAGSGLGTFIFPLLASFYVQELGWRLAWGAIGLTWGAVMMPLTYFFFFDSRDKAPPAAQKVPAKAPPYRHILKSRAFIFLTAGGVMFIWACSALNATHLVPILQAKGYSLTTAASLLSLVGLCSIAGRIGVGFLLDFVRTRPFAMVVFLLPMVVCLLLVYAQILPIAFLAVIILGFGLGAEQDVIAYIASRRFAHSVFGSVYAIFQTVTAVASVVGNVGVAKIYDLSGSYSLLLIVMPILAVMASLLIGMIPDTHGDVPPGTLSAEEEEALAAVAQTA